VKTGFFCLKSFAMVNSKRSLPVFFQTKILKFFRRFFFFSYFKKLVSRNYLSKLNKMAEIALVCKTKHEVTLLLNDFYFENSPSHSKLIFHQSKSLKNK
jgi:hypothetical protein